VITFSTPLGLVSGRVDTKRGRSVWQPWSRRSWRRILALAALAAAGFAGLSVHYHLGVADAPLAVVRVAAAPVLSALHGGDSRIADAARARYWVGAPELLDRDGTHGWHRLESTLPGFSVVDASGARALPDPVPFVYESAGAPYLRQLVDAYDLRAVVAGAATEYDAMLKLGAWVGGLFDHGADELGRRQNLISPVDVIRMGAAGKKFWCEVAARLMVHAATAIGWQARLATGSATGYSWDHAVAELWSNQHRKWFVLDADFNIVYESGGVPLSAFELCHHGLRLQQAGALTVRAISPPKPSLPTINLLPFYEYVHIDLRNDWNSRALGVGSPEGGDRATWWTARPSLGPVLTAKVREDRADRFDWPVNSVSLHAEHLASNPDATAVLRVGLAGYSPNFGRFEVSTDEDAWRHVRGSTAEFRLVPGRHVLRARVVTAAGHSGPAYSVSVDVPGPLASAASSQRPTPAGSR